MAEICDIFGLFVSNIIVFLTTAAVVVVLVTLILDVAAAAIHERCLCSLEILLNSYKICIEILKLAHDTQRGRILSIYFAFVYSLTSTVYQISFSAWFFSRFFKP